ncbi:MAG TPA: aldose epimerase family protein [Rhizomicrobium sp.]|jgi:aldose 1-epimerase
MRAFFTLMLFMGLSLPADAAVTSLPWGKTPDGKPVHLFTLTSASGIEAKITDFGGRIISIRVPDRGGNRDNIVQGFKELAPYLNDASQYGALIGRYANRIAGAQFSLDGTTYRLVTAPNATVQSHGGPNGYFRRVWNAKIQDGPSPRLVLSLSDPDSEMGFPGNLAVKVTYTLMRDRLRIDYFAATDKDTVVNLTNHSYFTLSGGKGATVDRQVLQVFGDAFLPADETGMPSGEIRPVEGTDFDFREPAALGPRLASGTEQMRHENGLDHTFVINGAAGTLRRAVRLSDPDSGRSLEVWTTQPGVQVYTANFISAAAKDYRHYVPHSAIAFEAQHFPNSPNQPQFPSTVVTPAKPLRETTEFRFQAGKSIKAP